MPSAPEERPLRLEEALHTLQQRLDDYHLLFQQAELAIVIVAADGQALTHNRAYAALMGGAAEGASPSCPPEQLSPPSQPDGGDSRQQWRALLALTLSAGEQRSEWRFCPRHGSEFTGALRLTPIPFQGRRCVRVIVRDLTLALDQERLLAARNQALEESNRELSHSLAEIKTLRGLIPICLHCKRIRDDDQGFWQKLEHYLGEHSEGKLTHGVCPECRDAFYSHIKTPNCWEYMRCGAETQQLCVTVVQQRGQECWLVAGTMCGGEPQGTLAKKILSCKHCDFYKFVTYPVESNQPENN